MRRLGRTTFANGPEGPENRSNLAGMRQPGAVRDQAPAQLAEHVRPSGPAEDPATLIALLYRVVDDPRRALCAVGILALPVSALTQLAGAQPVLGVPVGWAGVLASALGVSLTTWLTKRRRPVLQSGPADAGSGDVEAQSAGPMT